MGSSEQSLSLCLCSFLLTDFYSRNFKLLSATATRHHRQIPPPTPALLSATLLREISSKLRLMRNNFNIHNPSVFVWILLRLFSFPSSSPLPTQLSGGTASALAWHMFCHGKQQHWKLWHSVWASWANPPKKNCTSWDGWLPNKDSKQSRSMQTPKVAVDFRICIIYTGKSLIYLKRNGSLFCLLTKQEFYFRSPTEKKLWSCFFGEPHCFKRINATCCLWIVLL